MNRDDQHLRLLPDPEPDRLERLLDEKIAYYSLNSLHRDAFCDEHFFAKGWAIERRRIRALRIELEAERALRLDAQAELIEEKKAHGKIRVLAQLAAVKYKAETELRKAAIEKLRARYEDLRGSPHNESRGTGILEAIDAIEGATNS